MTDYDAGILIWAALWISSSGALRVGVANACYGQGPCSRHDLSCGVTSRLAIVDAVHGFKRKLSLCPGLATNHCNFNTKFCCKEDPVFDCTIPFKDVFLRTLYERCSGRYNCSYYTDRVKEECSTTTKTLSSYSSIKFSCVEETEMTQFWTRGTSSGLAVYAVFDPESFISVDNPLQQYSCRVEPVNGATSVNVNVSALDVRFDKINPGPCSSLLIRHKGGPSTNISCGAYRTRTFLSQVTHIDTVSTPVDLLLTLSEENLPGYVWIQMESETSELVLRCGALEKGWEDDDRTSEKRQVLSSSVGKSSMVGAVAGGVIVLAALAAILVGVIWWKRRANDTKYLQTIPLQSSSSKETVERRLRGQTGSTGANVTLQVRPPVSGEPESIYEHVNFRENMVTVSAFRMYHHLHHMIVKQDAARGPGESTSGGKEDGYDKCVVGSDRRLPKEMSAYDTTESASRDTDDIKRNVHYDHLEGKISINAQSEDIYENAASLLDENDVLNGIKKMIS